MGAHGGLGDGETELKEMMQPCLSHLYLISLIGRTEALATEKPNSAMAQRVKAMSIMPHCTHERGRGRVFTDNDTAVCTGASTSV